MEDLGEVQVEEAGGGDEGTELDGVTQGLNAQRVTVLDTPA